MNKIKTVGVVGGIGPEASNLFCELLVKNKTATKDQDNIPFLHFCNPQIPDRTDFIIGRGEDPTQEIIKTCLALQNAGSDFLVMPCNTAHFFLQKIQNSVEIPIIDMTKILVKSVLSEFPPITNIGILATTGSVKAEIYQKYFKSVGMKTIIPSEEDQENLVMRAIYGSSGLKAGKKMLPKKLLIKATKKLIDAGAQAIVLGCTEIPLVLKQKDFEVKLFNPMYLASKEIISYVEEEAKKEVVTVKYALEDFAKGIGRDLSIENLKEIKSVEVAL